MAGENPAQSAAMVGARGKLFGMQLNDGHTRLAAEDGLIFGSVHRSMALELMLWLRRTRFRGHLYFDTFPRNEDPIAEAPRRARYVQRAEQHVAVRDGAGAAIMCIYITSRRVDTTKKSDIQGCEGTLTQHVKNPL